MQPWRKVILDVLVTRLKMTVPLYRQIEAQVEAVGDLNRLRSLLQTAVQAPDVATFEQALTG